jgi:hypothetical protein
MRYWRSVGTGNVRRTLAGVVVGYALLCHSRANASSITINNISENTTFFHTEVKGGIGILPDFHFLVDIPNTPWESSSLIVEAPGDVALLPDKLGVRWTMEHLLGPDPQEIDPNPLGPTTLSLSFTPTAAGVFGNSAATLGIFACDPTVTSSVFAIAALAHPLATGGSAFDEFCLEVFGNVSSNIFGNFSIDSYTIEYFAVHCTILSTTGFGCAPPTFPGGGVGGMANAPEPATMILFGSGLLMQIYWKTQQQYPHRNMMNPRYT